jgi:E3 ubiquitin-protein ligase RGLG
MGCGASAKGKYQPEQEEESLAVREARAYESQLKTNSKWSLFKKKRVSSRIIPDNFNSYAELTQALRTAGLESSQLVLGVDFSLSNTWNGKDCLNGRQLHDTTVRNPYMHALHCISTALKDFDDDNFIPAYGFADARTKNQSIFSFKPNDEPCLGLDGVLDTYKQLAGHVELAGPTCFAPIIRHTINLVRETNEYHILVIIADGMVEKPRATVDAIIEASYYAMSIVMIGVGDGEWDLMEFFDDGIQARHFDNFQFVKFKTVAAEMEECFTDEEKDAKFTMSALMEVPDQYCYIKEEGLLRPNRILPKFKPPHAVLQPPRPKEVVKVVESIRLTPSQLDPAFNDPGYVAASPRTRRPSKQTISRQGSRDSDMSMSPRVRQGSKASKIGSKPSSPGHTEDTGIPSHVSSRTHSPSPNNSPLPGSSPRQSPSRPQSPVNSQELFPTSVVRRPSGVTRGTRSRQPSMEGLYRQSTTEFRTVDVEKGQHR